MLPTRRSATNLLAFRAPPETNPGSREREIRSIVWATGFRPDYSWLHVPVLDRKGYIRHEGGVADAPACTCWV